MSKRKGHSDKAEISFPDLRVAFCRKHLEPFRKDYPKGAPALVMLVFQKVLDSPDLEELLPRDEVGKLVVQPEIVNRFLLEHCPLCCYLGDGLMEDITIVALGEKN